jgi:hypothetical protein
MGRLLALMLGVFLTVTSIGKVMMVSDCPIQTIQHVSVIESVRSSVYE